MLDNNENITNIFQSVHLQIECTFEQSILEQLAGMCMCYAFFASKPIEELRQVRFLLILPGLKSM
jgi:hypothetical protein